MLELAFSWLAARPTVGSIIAGATRPEQIDANVKATGWTLSGGGDGGDRQDHRGMKCPMIPSSHQRVARGFANLGIGTLVRYRSY